MRLYDYAASGNCLKVRILLALLNQQYERIPVDIFAGGTLTQEYAALNPARETPVLETDDGDILLQSNAILWWLSEGTPYLPERAWERVKVLEWLMFEQEYVIPGIAAPRFWRMTGRGTPELLEQRVRLGETALSRVGAHLASRAFLVGDASSIADISLYCYLHVACDGGFDLAAYPSVRRWLAKLESLPGWADDLVPYPENAKAGMSRSIYD